MPEPMIQNVADTAFMVAVFRASENERPNPLFRDPWAAKLAGERGRKIVESFSRMSKAGEWMVVIRTHIIDRFIQSAIAEGCDTVVNLGAGLDTRPYRMELPASLRWIEVDYPQVIELKESRLASDHPRCRLERVKLDLADLPARKKLLDEIAATSKRAFILTEGVTPYLSDSAVASLADDLRSHAVFRYLVADYFSPATYRYRQRAAMKNAMKNAPFIFEPADYFGFFSSHGWRAREVCYVAEEGDKLGRPMPLPALAKPVIAVMRLLTPKGKRADFKRAMAYVLFENAGQEPAS